MSPLLQHIKGMLFDTTNMLFTTTNIWLSIDTAEHATELFNILQTNDRLKLLRVEIGDESVFTSSMGTSLQDMLKQNKNLILQDFEERSFIPINKIILSSLLTGLG